MNVPATAAARPIGAYPRRITGNALRASVLGMNDGLVSSLCLVLGVSGAGGDGRAIVVAGLAGLLAGALSMALGEWLSVQSARELFERQLALDPGARVHQSDLGPAAYVAAGTSFSAFAAGALLPLAPHLLGSGAIAMAISILLTGTSLFVVGAGVAVVTGRSKVWSGGRQLAFGLAAAAITYGLGRAVGIAVG